MRKTLLRNNVPHVPTNRLAHSQTTSCLQILSKYDYPESIRRTIPLWMQHALADQMKPDTNLETLNGDANTMQRSVDDQGPLSSQSQDFTRTLSQKCANLGKMGGMGVGLRLFMIYMEKWGRHGVKTSKKQLLFDRLGMGVANWHHQGRKNGGKWGQMRKIGRRLCAIV